MLQALLSEAGICQMHWRTVEVWKALRTEFSIQNISQGKVAFLICFAHQMLPLEMVWETGNKSKMETLQLPLLLSFLAIVAEPCKTLKKRGIKWSKRGRSGKTKATLLENRKGFRGNTSKPKTFQNVLCKTVSFINRIGWAERTVVPSRKT